MPFSFDGEFVESRQNHEILPEFMDGVGNEQQKTLRSFPNGSRNCYTLPSTIGKKYLLRATFTYGNYDRLNKTLDGSLFLFGLHIGVNFWDKVNLSNWDPSFTVWKEVLTVAPSNSVSVCLINFGSGVPFISSLELRPLQDTMYPFVNTSVSVSYFTRYRFGNITDFITRYPTDPYDRFWESWSGTIDYTYPWISLNTTNKVESLPGTDAFNVPSAIFQQASTIDTNYSFMSVAVATGPNIDTTSLQLLPIFHFAEINRSNPNRRFDIYSAEDLLFGDFSPSRFQVDSMYKNGQFLKNAYALFSLNKTDSSSLPPLINAFEVYSLVRMENLTTDSNDDGPIPDSIRQRVQAGLLDLRLVGNPVCANSKDTYCSDSKNNNKEDKKKKRNTTPILLIAVMVPVVLISLLVGMCILRKLYRKGKSGDNEDYASYEEKTPLHIDIRRFTYAELKLITNNFQSIIGKGGFGTVYHGILENGDEVAVKVLMETSIAESTDFLPEVQTLSKVHHKNLVTLQGYCQNKKCLALVYDFLPGGNLQQLLSGGDVYSLTWEQRLHIALDAAQGLHFSCVLAFRPYVCVSISKVKVSINYRTGVST
uniref:Uncharacterized protein n=1 Tax=Avena sativa TaxID=4498 RepID=A0ACD5VSX4_AVESA